MQVTRKKVNGYLQRSLKTLTITLRSMKEDGRYLQEDLRTQTISYRQRERNWAVA